MNNNYKNEYKHENTTNSKKKSKFKMLLIIFILLILVGGSIAGTGIASVHSLKSFLSNASSFLSTKYGTAELTNSELTNYIDNMTAAELLDALQDSNFTVKQSTFNYLKIKRGDLIYLLEKCVKYENQGKQTRNIKVQGKHVYTVMEESEKEVGTDESGNSITETVSKPVQYEKFVDRNILISNNDTEGMLSMDWRTLYIFSLINSVDRSRPKTETIFSFLADWKNADTGEIPSPTSIFSYTDENGNNSSWYIRQKDIDQAFAALSMDYDYAVDILRDSKGYYTLTECISLPHVTDISGDPNTEAGEYTYYYPRSLINSARSGYSELYYVMNNNNIVGIQEHFFTSRFDAIGPALCYFYSDNYFKTLLTYLPGGTKIYQKFQYYKFQAENGNAVIYSGNFLTMLGDYSLPLDHNTIEGSALQLNYGNSNNLGADGIYSPPSSVGEAAVNLALTRLDWKYTQNVTPANGPTRTDIGYWDCSSMIGRLYNELGVSISGSSNTFSLQTNAIGFNQKIDETEMIPGDAYWLSNGSGRHVVMYCGNGMVVHAKGTDYGTVYESVQSFKSQTSKTIQFCFRPYKGIASSWVPPVHIGIGGGGTQSSEFLLLNETEAAEKILAMAVNDAQSSGILPSITAAQMILESAYVKSGLAVNANNCFGMKTILSNNDWIGTTWNGTSIYSSWTSEQDASGKDYKIYADFRSYSSIEDSVSDHSSYLLGAKNGSGLRYAGLTAATNYTEAITIIKNGGYATDISYIAKVSLIIRRFNLDRYDTNYKSIVTNKPTTAASKVSLDLTWAYASLTKINTGAAMMYRSNSSNKNGIVIAVNAGHGTRGGSSIKTQCHPDGSAKVTGGTTSAGSTTALAVSGGMTFLDNTQEAIVTLSLATILKDELLSRGYDVLMIRDAEDVQLDNIARTIIANNSADCHISLHWDSTSTDKGAFYMSVPNVVSYRNMEPVKSHWQSHNALGEQLINGLRSAGSKIFSSGSMEMDLTQTSYSTIPSVDIELGDRASGHSSLTLNNLSRGLANGIDSYFSN